ncbi:MAG: PstS family phosphate ABC transporter substrate-binding protein [Candidatus Ranarchaeia archaeon]
MRIKQSMVMVGLCISILVSGLIATNRGYFILPLSEDNRYNHVITIAGSTTVFPLSEIWAEEYHLLYPNITIQVAKGGSGFGQKAVGSKDIDIGASSTPIQTVTLERYPGLKQIPIALDGLAVILNAQVNGTGLQKLNREAIIAIYQGNVTTWEELEAQYGVAIRQRGQIQVYARADASGTTDTFSRWLSTNSTFWRLGHNEIISWGRHVITVEGNQGVATAVSKDAAGIGYVGLAFANETINPHIKQVAIKNPSTGKYVLPRKEFVKAAVPQSLNNSSEPLFNRNATNAYPIVRMMYYIINNESVSYLIVKYIHWCLTTGQNFVHEVGYIEISSTKIENISLSILEMYR